MSKPLFTFSVTQKIGASQLKNGAGLLSSQKMNILSKYLLSDIRKLGSNSPLDDAGRLATKLIRKRTLKGISTVGNSFERLSGSTRKKRNIGYAGRKKKAIAEGKVSVPSGSVRPPKSNLYFSGKMLGSLGYFKDKQPKSKKFAFGLTMGFRGNHHGGTSNKRLAELHTTGTSKMPARPFMGLSSTDRVKVLKKFKAGLTRDLKQRLKN